MFSHQLINFPLPSLCSKRGFLFRGTTSILKNTFYVYIQPTGRIPCFFHGPSILDLAPLSVIEVDTTTSTEVTTYTLLSSRNDQVYKYAIPHGHGLFLWAILDGYTCIIRPLDPKLD